MNEAEACHALGLQMGADAACVKAAFRSVALRCHPDRAPGDPGAAARFAEAKQAHDLLARIAAARDAATASPPGPRRNGPDIEVEVAVTLEQAAGLVPTELVGGSGGPCPACSGSGRRPLPVPQTCEACSGDGVVRISRGLMRVRTPCGACAGAGTLRHCACRQCGGTGALPASSPMLLTLPAGTAEGDTIRVEGRGAPGSGGGAPGALKAKVAILRHPHLRRRGDDLLAEVRVSFADLCLGCAAEATSLGGARVPFDLPPGTPSGSVVAVPGQGMPIRTGPERGKLLVRVEADVPREMTEEQADLARRWRELEAG